MVSSQIVGLVILCKVFGIGEIDLKLELWLATFGLEFDSFLLAFTGALNTSSITFGASQTGYCFPDKFITKVYL